MILTLLYFNILIVLKTWLEFSNPGFIEMHIVLKSSQVASDFASGFFSGIDCLFARSSKFLFMSQHPFHSMIILKICVFKLFYLEPVFFPRFEWKGNCHISTFSFLLLWFFSRISWHLFWMPKGYRRAGAEEAVLLFTRESVDSPYETYFP